MVVSVIFGYIRSVNRLRGSCNRVMGTSIVFLVGLGSGWLFNFRGPGPSDAIGGIAPARSARRGRLLAFTDRALVLLALLVGLWMPGVLFGVGIVEIQGSFRAFFNCWFGSNSRECLYRSGIPVLRLDLAIVDLQFRNE